jgi:hypothetical protein
VLVRIAPPGLLPVCCGSIATPDAPERPGAARGRGELLGRQSVSSPSAPPQLSGNPAFSAHLVSRFSPKTSSNLLTLSRPGARPARLSEGSSSREFDACFNLISALSPRLCVSVSGEDQGEDPGKAPQVSSPMNVSRAGAASPVPNAMPARVWIVWRGRSPSIVLTARTVPARSPASPSGRSHRPGRG